MRRRVLVDECLPVQLHRWLDEFDVRIVAFMGWKGKRNGELLAAAAEEKFEVLLTNDRFLPREHDAGGYRLGIVVLTSHRLRAVERLVPAIAEALAGVSPGTVVRVAAKPA
jgi:predicted nuclease of predicted toxin-antitoxin system